MKLVVILCLVALACSAPPSKRYSPNDVRILRYDNDYYSGLGNYKYGFEQSDGTRHDQQGFLQNEGRENEYLAVKGRFSWIAPNGVRYTVTYTADDNGYQPEVEEGPGAVPDAVAATLIG